MQLDDSEREELFDLLSRHAALSHIDLHELEQRVERVIQAENREAAVSVLADLPPLPPPKPERLSRTRRRSGHGEAATAKIDWIPTGERFRDPGSSQIMRVWTDPDGGRHYVPEP